MSLDIQGIVDAVQNHALECGHFESVNGFEPKSAPATQGLVCAVWVDQIRGALSSGQASTSALMVFNVRLYTNMLARPPDAIDPRIVAALDALLTAYVGDLTLGGRVRSVDVRGMEGVPLNVQAGYLNQDGKMFRTVTITLPLIVNDVWTEAP